MPSLKEYSGFWASPATKSNTSTTKNILNKEDDYFQELEKTLKDESKKMSMMGIYKKVRKK